ncbi:MAG: efflux RND transporter permease subunit, partial [Solirubrobacteraceae bacterium]
MRDEVAKARRVLPREVEPPTVSKTNYDDQPILWIPFNSTRSAVETSEYIRRHVKPVLETIDGVGGITLFGRHDRAIRIWVDGEALRAHGLSAGDVLSALRREHVDVPGGVVEGSKIEWSVKTDAEFRSTAALEEMVIAHHGDAPVHLKDVARVEDGETDVRSLARYNGVPTVGVGVRKQTGGNTVAICDEVFKRLQELRPLLPEGISLSDGAGFIDFSRSIRESVAETQFALVFGGLLAVLTVFVFLRRIRPTLVVAAAIPVSLITTFALVWLAGYTLNTMTLLGMALAIGVVIDDAIIVLENIERHREMGKDARQAAIDGTRQITFAATAATLSVTAVFLPVVFVKGIIGNFLGEFGLTVAGSVMISLFVALTLTPMLASRMAPPKERKHGGVYHALEVGFLRLERAYERALDWALGHQWTTLG